MQMKRHFAKKCFAAIIIIMTYSDVTIVIIVFYDCFQQCVSSPSRFVAPFA